MTSPVFELPLTVAGADIDELGHVNNAVYVRWLQEAGTAHWFALATPDEAARMAWVVTRLEVDYLKPTMPGETVSARTWVGEQHGARFERHVEIVGAGGVKARAKVSWALLEAATMRPMRVPKALVARFRGEAA